MKSTVLRICRDNIIIIKFGGNNLILACFVQETISIIFDGDQVLMARHSHTSTSLKRMVNRMNQIID
jgi:hypothetical protein